MTNVPALHPVMGIGSTLALAARVFARNPLPILFLNALPCLPALVITLFTRRAAEDTPSTYLLSASLSLVLLFYAQGATIDGVHRAANGKAFGLREAMIGAWWWLPFLTGAGLLFGLITSLGFAALFIPGLMAIAILYITLPACMIERLGMVDSLERSAMLTHAYRWRVFGLFLLTTLPMIAISAITSMASRPTSSLIVPELSDALGTLLFSAITAVSATACFEQLRLIKGTSPMGVFQAV